MAYKRFVPVLASLVCVLCGAVGLWTGLNAQPLPPRAVDLEVIQNARAQCEQQLATLLEHARALQREVDDLKKQLLVKETP